ncbi:hypothetical protein C8Q80DRAFT_1142354 [Daedaleopsis nitida]|nr:hypothetical protein C8Q80DRAFT_1142354 [Daedaleopsis nitida]
MAMAALPPELVDSILGCVYYTKGVADRRILSSCALLCRAWSGPAQRLLFRHATLWGMHHGREHLSFMEATNPGTERGRTLGGYVRVLEVLVGDKAGMDLDDADLASIIERTPRLYELILRVTGIHQLGDDIVQKLKQLARPKQNSNGGGTTLPVEDSEAGCVAEEATPTPVRIRALSLLSCGVQSPILYQLLSVWPSIEFLFIGVEIAAPIPRWLPECRLYQLTLMRTPRPAIMSWLLSSSMQSLRIVSFRDAPGRELDPLFEEFGPRLRSLRLMNYSLRAASVLKMCPNLEEFVLVQLSTLFELENLPPSLEHLNCRNLPSEDQSLASVVRAVDRLPRLRVVTCAKEAQAEETFEEMERICAHKNIELHVDETPFWVPEEPVYVDKFPRSRSVASFALMN